MLHNDQFEVMTPSGWQDFDGIAASVKKVLRVVTTSRAIRTSMDHLVIVAGKAVKAVSLKPGMRLARGISVVSVSMMPDVDVLYDLVNVGGGNLYIADGVVHHNCEFQGSSGTLITGDKLQKLAFTTPVFEDENVCVYAHPEPNNKYIMTVDVSEGVDRDYSVVSIFDVTVKPFRHVLTYRNNSIPPEVLTEVAYRLGKKYNYALAIVETNGVGVSVAKDLWFEYEYENVVKTVAKEQGAKVGYGAGSTLGVKTTKSTKRVGCSTLKSLIETDLLITNDYTAISEFGTFVMQGSSWGAEEGKTDDVVMTFVIFAWFTQQMDFEDYMTGTVNAELRKSRDEERFGLASFFFTDGTEDDEGEDLSLVMPANSSPRRVDIF